MVIGSSLYKGGIRRRNPFVIVAATVVSDIELEEEERRVVIVQTGADLRGKLQCGQGTAFGRKGA